MRAIKPIPLAISLSILAAGASWAQLEVAPSREMKTGERAVFLFEAAPGLEAGTKVSFFDGETPIGTARLQADGVAAFGAVFLTEGFHTIRAAAWNSSQSHTITVRVTGTQPERSGEPRTYPAGPGPRKLLLADLNRDDLPEAIVTNEENGAISILPGAGEGRFGAPLEIETGKRPAAIAAADFDGNGYLDLAVADAESSTIGILLTSEEGNPAWKRLPFEGLATHSSILAADFDRDGISDLALLCQSCSRLAVFRGLGDGSFEWLTEAETGQNAETIIAGDWNADGWADIALTHRDSRAIAVLAGTGDGGFGEPATLQASRTAKSLLSWTTSLEGASVLAVRLEDNSAAAFRWTAEGAFLSTEPDAGLAARV